MIDRLIADEAERNKIKDQELLIYLTERKMLKRCLKTLTHKALMYNLMNNKSLQDLKSYVIIIESIAIQTKNTEILTELYNAGLI